MILQMIILLSIIDFFVLGVALWTYYKVFEYIENLETKIKLNEEYNKINLNRITEQLEERYGVLNKRLNRLESESNKLKKSSKNSKNFSKKD